MALTNIITIRPMHTHPYIPSNVVRFPETPCLMPLNRKSAILICRIVPEFAAGALIGYF